MKNRLRQLTETLSSMLLKLDLDIKRLLTSTYLRGSNNKDDYGPLAYTGDLPYKIPQAYDDSLDKIGSVFDVKRQYRESDESYRQRIIFSVRRSTTNKGIEDTVKFIFENSPYFSTKSSGYKISFDVNVYENYLNSFDGITSGLNTPVRGELTYYNGIMIVIKPIALVDGLGNRKLFVKSYDFTEIVKNSEVSGIRQMMSFLVASGIKVDRVIIEQPGAGGSKGEIYAYSKTKRL